jgi:hypothetical protein
MLLAANAGVGRLGKLVVAMPEQARHVRHVGARQSVPGSEGAAQVVGGDLGDLGSPACGHDVAPVLAPRKEEHVFAGGVLEGELQPRAGDAGDGDVVICQAGLGAVDVEDASVEDDVIPASLEGLRDAGAGRDDVGHMGGSVLPELGQ